MNTVRLPLLVVLAASIAVVGAALVSQYWGGLVPCELCLYERWPYYIAIGLALLTLALPQPAWSRHALLLLALLFVASAALAFYHVGIEQHWFAGPSACTSSGHTPQSLAELKATLARTQAVQCDEPQWSLWAITLAGWNFIVSVLMALFAFFAWRHRYEARNARAPLKGGPSR